MSISKLKDDARRHELREEWEKAVQVYHQVLLQAEHGEGDVELPLYNRIGDLYIRLNRPQEAVRYYEQAADRYAEAGLYNNAIALCNKALRYDSQHLTLLRKLGTFSALQGFHTDARRYFVDYAEKQVSQGHGDEALRALEDYVKVADNAESKELYGRRLCEHGRPREGIALLRAAYDLRVSAGETEYADAIRAELQAIDPAITFGDDRAATATESITEMPAPAEAAPAERVVETGPSGELEIERTSFEPPDSDYGMIDVGRFDSSVHGESDASRIAAVEGLESATTDFAAADVQQQDLGSDFERDEIAFIAPQRDEPSAKKAPEDVGDLPLLPDIELGMPADEEPEAAPFQLSNQGPLDAPLIDLSALDGGLMLPPLDETAGRGARHTLESDFAAFDLPLLGEDETPSELDEPDIYAFSADTAPDLPDLPALADPDAAIAFEEPTDDLVDDAAPQHADSALLDVGVELDAGEEHVDTPDTEMEFEAPPERGAATAADARAPFGRSLAGWPEDRDDDYAVAATHDELTLQDTHAPLADEVELEAATEWEEQAHAAAEDVADAMDLEDEPVAAEIDELLEIDEPITADDLTDAEFVTEPMAAHADATFVELDEEAGTDEFAEPAYEYARHEEPSAELLDEEEAAATETVAVEPALDAYAAQAVQADAAVLEAPPAQAKEMAPPVMTSGVSTARSEAPPPPPAPKDDGYVDLNALLVDDHEATTRFRIQETAPSGDEDQDFAELLGRFKEKVAQHLPAEDAAAHYDLGLAFKEMGLIDEAIAEFQVALRTGPMRLKVYEELGQCFLQKEQYNIAEKVLRQALQVEYQHELDLLGIYYQLGRAYEAMGRREQARDAYERVLGMDLSFQDTSARLAKL